MSYKEFRKGSDKIAVAFRNFRREDAAAVIDCIKDEYGDSYFKKNFYSTDSLIEEHESGHIRFLVIEKDDGRIIGMLAVKRFLPREEMCEIASEIFLREYRGYGMAYPMFQYALAQIRRMNKTAPVSAIYCLPVLFHDITQRLMERMELMPTGFVFGKFLMGGINHSYAKDANLKHPQGIMIRRLSKKDAGVIYVPTEHRQIVQKIYDSLSVPCRFGESAPGTGASIISHEQDDKQKNCNVSVDAAGADFNDAITALHEKYTDPYQTFNVFLNISSPNAINAYRALTERGYFFAGLQPLCSERELMVLNHPGNIPIHMDTLALTPNFSSLRDYVQKYYEHRRQPSAHPSAFIGDTVRQ